MIKSSALKLRVPEWPYAARNLFDVARRQADREPAGLPFTFIDYSGACSVDSTLSYTGLDRRARQIAALLQTRGRPGERVLLLYPAGLDYLCAFFGCLYAGMIAVPAYPPLNPRLRSRLAAVADDCQASTALTTHAVLTALGERTQLPPPLARLRWITTDDALDAFESAWREPMVDREQIAFLQYTSGSTGTPKGVMVTHSNLLHNLCAIALHLQFSADDHHLTWLPPYHDMGLIGAILGSFCAGVPVSFMMPASFLRRPERWLREISSRRCTVSGAPNFAYELCLDKVPDDDLATLDLSCWTLAYSGAEPVRADTLARFSQRFGSCGFQRRSFYPCYGMAETTLFVTGKQRDDPPSTVTIDASLYANDLVAMVVADAESGAPSVEIVSCGIPADGHDVLIVEPATLSPLSDGAVGEIVVSGPSVAAGYWQREADTAATFGAHVAERATAFLRTGDLGFMRAGELYVSGRLKDMIISRGVNHYPQDIEGTVNHCHEAIRPGCGIAFSVSEANEERLVFVQEVGRREGARADEIFRAMREAIVERHDVQPFAIALIESGTIPKTTSGKLSRRPCREDFLGRKLALIAQWTNPLFVGASSADDTPAFSISPLQS
jgi:acyl-CoA synthetase (AMP-forming)/AMP-acid ligase II